MRSCFQFEGLSVLDHGISVRERYLDLTDHLMRRHSLQFPWRLPDWVESPRLLQQIGSFDDRLIGLYQVYHDCGKPLCRELDAEGRQHFPDHAAVSMGRWLECSDRSLESLQVARLIGMDMDIHLLRPEGVGEFAARPEAAVLLMTGLAELHSNSAMFGGIGSTGFKIKHKRISRLGSRIAEALR